MENELFIGMAKRGDSGDKRDSVLRIFIKKRIYSYVFTISFISLSLGLISLEMNYE